MNEGQRTAVFIDSLYKGNPQYLIDLEQYARDTYVPVIRPGTQSALRTFLAAKNPKKILEIGSAIGFSALFMAEFSNAAITTIEHAPERIRQAEENFKKYKMDHRITLLPGDAEDILGMLAPSYDFIFMDAAKGQYIHFYPEVKRLLAPGGLLVSDNIMQEGEIIRSHYAVERRNRTIYKRMREYLYTITHDADLTTTIFTIGDGLALSVKKESV